MNILPKCYFMVYGYYADKGSQLATVTFRLQTQHLLIHRISREFTLLLIVHNKMHKINLNKSWLAILSFCLSLSAWLSVYIPVWLSVWLTFWHPVDILINFCFDNYAENSFCLSFYLSVKSLLNCRDQSEIFVCPKPSKLAAPILIFTT